jgi:hypothetical protein
MIADNCNGHKENLNGKKCKHWCERFAWNLDAMRDPCGKCPHRPEGKR